MARARIVAGICGFQSAVSVRNEGSSCTVTIESDCPAVERLAAELKEVDPLREVSRRGETPQTWQLAARHGLHASCPVPVGILKAVEVEAGLALAANVLIELSAAGIESGGEPDVAAHFGSRDPATGAQSPPSQAAGQGMGPGMETMRGRGMGRGRGIGRGWGKGMGRGRRRGGDG
jgi:hypothetical protein